ncbi:hypothetical protein [Streptomyces sp. NPDC017993]|uniref:hypothetical protein n=1 Tax=Streptomyces sp. NPDC017993 TaxID=3365027 RepID=UPI0037A8A241
MKASESAGRYGRRKAQLRYSFVERATPDDPPPPMAQMLRGGRGGHVRLKLYLSYLWMQREDVAQGLTFTSRAWATLLDLPDPPKAGARRISDAQSWLTEHRFITVDAQPGRPNQVVVLNETGNGEPYTAPGAAAKKEAAGLLGAVTHRYVQIPKTFWTNGHLTLLSGAGLAMFLVLLCQRGPADDDTALWFSPKEAQNRYDLSEDTRGKGLRELADAGLVTTKRRAINPTDFEVVHMRNVHYLKLDRLNETASLTPKRRVVRIPKKRAATD